MEETLNEELLEQLYWDFDAERKIGKLSERDIFKGKMRLFARRTIRDLSKEK
jgi:hypothetical protein